MKRCVVTGATGHIGNVLVRELLRQGHQVKALVLPHDDISSLYGLDVEMVQGNVLDKESLIQAFSDADCIFHLAGIIDISRGKYQFMYQVNVLGTQNVIDVVKMNANQRLVYVSSIHAIPFFNQTDFIKEIDEFNPDNVKGGYGKTKAIATQSVYQAIQEGLNAVVLFPTGVIGPYEFKTSNIGQLLIEFVNRRLGGSVNGAYNFVDVRDVVDGIIKAAESSTRDGYILGGERITVRELFHMLQEITGVKAPRLVFPTWFVKSIAIFAEAYYKIRKIPPLFTSYSLYTLTSNSYISSKKAIEKLNYHPRPLYESVRDMVKWYQNKRNLKIASTKQLT